MLGSQELGHTFGITPDAMRGVQDVLYLSALGLQAPPVSLAPADPTRGFRYYQARHAIYQLSLTLLLAAVTWGGVNFYRQLAALDEITLTQANIHRHETLYRQIACQFPSTPASAENLRQAVAVESEVRRMERAPDRLMALVSGTLDARPEIRLLELRWRVTAESAATPQQVPRLIETGEIAGEVSPFDGDYKAAIGRVSAFADRPTISGLAT